MCQFCVQHGDGKKWFLEASSYAADLSSDLKRRGYMLDFIHDFDSSRANAIAGLGVLNRMPSLVQAPVKSRFVRYMRENHYGQPVTIEEAAEILDVATSVVRMPCICRRYAATKDEAWCMAITTRPVDDVLAEGFGSLPDGPDVSQFQHLDKEGALTMLREAEEHGLMHSVWTFVTPFIGAICNCNLASGCMAMRITLDYDTKIMWKGHALAEVDGTRCEGCARCVGHCPFKAMRWLRAERRAEVDPQACWGCGVCRAACASGAIGLSERSSVPTLANAW